MGIQPHAMQLIEMALDMMGAQYKGLKMLELGNQHVRPACGKGKHLTGKEYFTERGVEHVSLDQNGRDGAITVDLSGIISQEKVAHGYWDMVTNFGVSEHVLIQYPVFLNIHNWLRAGGVSVHVVPLAGYYRDHSPHHYRLDFFKVLAAVNDYELIFNDYIAKNPSKGYKMKDNCAVIRKVVDAPFVSQDEWRETCLEYLL